MVFACQKDSFLKELDTSVVSCKEAKVSINNNGKKEVIDGFEIVLEDTIIFPEGGGQPWDLGTIAEKEIIQAVRRGAEAVHVLREPLDVGRKVTVKLDWNRRLDHMQQHSGQHLITAVACAEYGFATSSWSLGEEISYIELDTPSISADQVVHVETLVNQYIRECRPVTVQVYEASDPVLKEVRTRGLPEDHVGLVRVVSIEKLENNMCCGTHVSNLSQLQMIKLTGVEKGKKNKTKLSFLSGNRVLKKMEEFLVRETALSNLLQNKGSVHVQLVEKIQDALKTTSKNLQVVLRELAIAEAEKLKKASPKLKFSIIHRKEADMDFINAFLREFNDEEILVLLIVGEEPAIQVVLHGKPEIVAEVGPRLSDIMEGKGFGKGHKYQAKVGKLKMEEATQILNEYFKI
ncbi:alanyl-tRNA editing protein Aarsd1-B [Frankliniella occidentalis]|uniref:Alanyl-tRNA editing protein Aarsd1-B n=1 Tax=Frankliniella occidentalis TaxID=133901 RepID=A0A6J1RVE4_FRAOC|nr:alanyl-tRNA editing protein Aarsd1-B [Frankliniella occidentalis]